MAKSLLIQHARIVDPAFKGRGKFDILIQKGKISRIAKDIDPKGYQVWDVKGACVCPGFFDIGTQIGDPGIEFKEDLQSAAAAARSGGYTALACFPNTDPVVHSKSEVLYIKNSSERLPVDIHPIGAVSRNTEGLEITEMYDMRAAGAVAFSDGITSVQHSGVLMRALLYVKPFHGLVINRPLDEMIASHGMLHEGLVSTSLGLQGIPSLAEALNVQREIYMTEYSSSRLHFHLISAAESVRLIREAKSQGIQISASVSPFHLIFTDDALMDFNSDLKLMPPIREETDREALISGLLDGTIDVISSGHVPQDQESKSLEFAYARFGAISLQTCLSSLISFLGDRLKPEDLVRLLSVNPRKLMGMEVCSVTEGSVADLCIFDPKQEWRYSEESNYSKSNNSPFLGQTLKGKVLGSYSKARLWKNPV